MAFWCWRQPQHKQGGQQGYYKGQHGQQVTDVKAGKGKGLCHKHQKFGEDAFNCSDKKNCTWLGN